jgi:hypothetical protein
VRFSGFKGQSNEPKADIPCRKRVVRRQLSLTPTFFPPKLQERSVYAVNGNIDGFAAYEMEHPGVGDPQRASADAIEANQRWLSEVFEMREEPR